MPRTLLLILVLLSLLSASARAQDSDPTPHRILDIQSRAFEAIDQRNYAQADRLLREQIKLDPDNFVPYYNLACVLSLKNEPTAAGDMLIKAVEHGFVDIHQLTRDPQLAAARRDPAYKNLVSSWPDILDQHLEQNLANAGDLFDGKNGPYASSRDQRLRIAYLSAM